MDAFDQAFLRTVGVEGGYSNHPNDPGGETMWGVTIAVARADGYSGPMKDLPIERAKSIYKRRYWDPVLGDQLAALSVKVALEVFDTNVNFYAGAAVLFLQRSLMALGQEVIVDGHAGPGTVAALGAFLSSRHGHPDNEVVLLRCLNALQAADYVRQCEAAPTKRAFFYGWVRARVVI